MSRSGVAVGLTGVGVLLGVVLLSSKKAKASEKPKDWSQEPITDAVLFPLGGAPWELTGQPTPPGWEETSNGWVYVGPIGTAPIPGPIVTPIDYPPIPETPLPKSAETHVVRADGTDWPSQLALQYTGDASRWPELCEANPQLAPHPKWGCVYPPAGSLINLPPSWVIQE